MGRSFSVFLFCLAMDPIYHYMNRIPRVISVQGYIDDNTIAGPGHDITWVSRVHKCYQCCWSAGLSKLTSMLVGKLSALTVSPFQSNPCLGGLKVKLFSDKKKYPTARAAILSAILFPKNTHTCTSRQVYWVDPSRSLRHPQRN